MMASDSLFRQKAPGIMNLLMADFALDLESAAAILGNLGHESGGFQFLQEKRPLVPGSEGGYGWAQWTGPRRDAYEAYCARNGFDPASDTANYKFLFLELRGSERAAIPAVKNAVGLESKVRAFELAFERAHKDYKHYESRVEWADRALDAYRLNPGGTLAIADAPAPAEPGLPAPVSGIDPKRMQEIIALVLSLIPVLTGKPLPAPAVEPAPKPVPTSAPTDTAVRTDVRAGILGLVGSLAASYFGVIGDPAGPASTATGALLPLLSVGAAAIGLPAPLVKLGGAAISWLAGRIAK